MAGLLRKRCMPLGDSGVLQVGGGIRRESGFLHCMVCVCGGVGSPERGTCKTAGGNTRSSRRSPQNAPLPPGPCAPRTRFASRQNRLVTPVSFDTDQALVLSSTGLGPMLRESVRVCVCVCKCTGSGGEWVEAVGFPQKLPCPFGQQAVCILGVLPDFMGKVKKISKSGKKIRTATRCCF